MEPRRHRIGSSGTSYDESALCTRGLFLGIWGDAWVGGVGRGGRRMEEDGWGGGQMGNGELEVSGSDWLAWHDDG